VTDRLTAPTYLALAVASSSSSFGRAGSGLLSFRCSSLSLCSAFATDDNSPLPAGEFRSEPSSAQLLNGVEHMLPDQLETQPVRFFFSLIVLIPLIWSFTFAFEMVLFSCSGRSISPHQPYQLIFAEGKPSGLYPSTTTTTKLPRVPLRPEH
jgi:hypothetical protein